MMKGRDDMQVVKTQKIIPGFVSMRDFLKRAKSYGVEKQLILDMVEANIIRAYPFDEHGLLASNIDVHHCYVKEGDVAQCIDALAKMEVHETLLCLWKQEYPLKAEVQPCVVYLPAIVVNSPYFTKRLIDSCVIQCASELNGVNAIEIVYRTEQDREQAIIHHNFPHYVLSDLVKDMLENCAVFAPRIRARNMEQAKRCGYFPARYIRLPLPE